MSFIPFTEKNEDKKIRICWSDPESDPDPYFWKRIRNTEYNYYTTIRIP